MENYQIILDEDKLKEFIEWLPNLENHETYMCCLFARSKYCDLIKSDKQQLRRFTSDKKYLLNKIKQLETKLGTYSFQEKYTDNYIPIPQEALSLYITLNPRDMLKATKNSLIEFANLITNDYNGYNPHQKVLSNIQTSCSHKYYMEFDYDKVDYEYVKLETEKYLDKSSLNYLITRGGVHCLVELESVDNKKYPNWYKNLQSINGFDNTATELMPVPGTYQGGFCPELIKAELMAENFFGMPLHKFPKIHINNI